MIVLHFTDGSCAGVRVTKLARWHRRGFYSRASDWLAQAGETIAWGRTRGEAIRRLREMLSPGLAVPPPRAERKRVVQSHDRRGVQ
jgi:hypothetical protein